ncbi:MAG TPA: cytidine deaminase [Rubricoccaceae bacterium]|nr:cytidine deaminase [Rubricoccaceae bacterium]
MPADPLDALRAHARAVAPRAYVPYTRQPEAAALLLSDGVWVPGVRTENAAFPLLIPALVAAATMARATGRTDVRAAVLTRPFEPGEIAFLLSAFEVDWQPVAADALVTGEAALPAPSDPLDPALPFPAPASDAEAVALAEIAARRAHAPYSDFPVGCVVETADGRVLPGANVEHPDWTRGLCAERVALATARALGYDAFRRITVVCPRAPGATPCGSCRQVLAELAPGVPLVIGRGAAAPETTTPEALLPGAFSGNLLRSVE